MARRKTKEKEIKTVSRKGKGIKSVSMPAAKSAQGRSKQKDLNHDFRFRVSLVMMIALLSAATYLLLFALNGTDKIFPSRHDAPEKSVIAAASAKAKPPVNSKKLEDKALGFSLTFPSQFGEWMYKVGEVVSPVDETLTNQYVNIYVPASGRSASSNFEEKYFNILTIRKYSQNEWDKLGKGCEKGNEMYCEQAGAKIAEKDGSVWTKISARKCSQEAVKECKSVESVVKSFQLN